MPLSEVNKKMIKTYLDGFESKEEFAELDNWFGPEDSMPLLQSSQLEKSRLKIRKRLVSSVKEDSPRPNITYLRMVLRIAATIAVVVSAFWGYRYYAEHYIYQELNVAAIAQIKPFQDSVKLTFENGKVVFLSSKDGQNQDINGVQTIVDGQLVYNATSDAVVNNIVTTPKGNIFKIDLPDGSKVWMNAKSELSFPSKFVGAERVVRLEGEAYFEVAKDDEQPFVVTFGDQKVKVLGTHFNITAYDEGVQHTTLIEGKVQVERGGETMMLSPNEQVTMVGGKMRKKSIDASEYIAWKEGYFVFHNATPNEIMQQLTYWYDLKVRPDGSGSRERFSGKISKQMNLADVLEVLQVAGIHFKISENSLKHKEIELRE